jgi:hypothetical protein
MNNAIMVNAHRVPVTTPGIPRSYGHAGLWITPRILCAVFLNEHGQAQQPVRCAHTDDGCLLLADCLVDKAPYLAVSAAQAARDPCINLFRRHGITVWLVPTEMTTVVRITAGSAAAPHRLARILAHLVATATLYPYLRRLPPIGDDRQLCLAM